MTDFLQVDIRAHENAFAVFADRLHAAGPAKNNLRATVRTIGSRLRHRELFTGDVGRFFMSVTGSSFQFRLIRPLQPPDRNCIRSEEILQNRFEIPFGATNATEKIEAQRSVFRKGVAREMRFGE